VRRAGAVLAGGGVVAYPTEGVFGLGCDPERDDAVARIAAFKGRRLAKGLILIGAEPRHVAAYAAPLSAAAAERIAAASVPTTWLVPRGRRAPDWITGGRPHVAVRVTRHPVAAALCEAFGGAIVSTSANRAGAPAPTSPARARLLVGAEVDCFVFAECGGLGRPSPIVEAASGRVIRA
jgi:L-threonylcarbamoyladenylate synthase